MCDYETEDLMISAKEHKILQKCKKRLKKRFNVNIQMPNLVTSAECESDIIFISISGETRNRERVKKFLSKRANMTTEKVECKENVLLITLSDSDEEIQDNEEDRLMKTTNDLNSEDSPVCDLCHLDDSIYISESTDNSSRSKTNYKSVSKEKSKQETERNHFDDSVIIESVIPDNFSRSKTNDKTVSIKKSKQKTKRKNVSSKDTLPDTFEDVDLCEVSSTTGELMHKKRGKVGVLTQELTEFIPLHKTKKSRLEEVEPSSCPLSTEQKKDDVLIINDDPLPSVRPLRPIVIDGSNVAREHGKISNTFSAKGIKLAVDYFLNRGHTQVTAFVPRFRRFCNRNNFPTTDPEILDDLATKQHVVFTPSRRINGKCIVSYDDRFIVQLAAANGGVILSNDNYRDLISENDSFKEVIENRLLLFCFVGDMLMIPSDPMGRAGPSLDHFLSFPPDTEKL